MLRYLVTATLLAASVTAAPLLALRATSQGCGKAQTSGYSGPITIQSGGRSRTFKVQVGVHESISAKQSLTAVKVPSGYSANAGHSLIIDFGKISTGIAALLRQELTGP
jgi:hypothetical protein